MMMVSRIMDREYDSATALTFAVLVMLLVNPLVITSIGFQMSVGCVIGILLFQNPISAWILEKLGNPKRKTLRTGIARWFASSVSVSLSALILTAPLSAVYFGTVSLVSILTNLLTLWAVSLAFYGITAVCVISLISIKAAAILAALAAWPMRFVLGMSQAMASLPLAVVYSNSIAISAWLIFVYVLLGAFLLSKERKPLIFSCCAVLGLCLALFLSWTEHSFWDVHFTALDVGQGQCLILHSEGRTYLIDCGGSHDETAANRAADTLLGRGITRLDGIILTHGDRDHAGGLPYLLKRIDADFLMIPAGFPRENLEAVTGGWGGEVIFVDRDLSITMDRGNMTVFGPEIPSDSDENGLCILFENQNCGILITGDRGQLGEMLLLQRERLPDVDLLIAGHHGSKNSTTGGLLERVRPEYVYISVGNNGYGHPARETLLRLEQFGCQVFRTDMQGDLIFRR